MSATISILLKIFYKQFRNLISCVFKQVTSEDAAYFSTLFDIGGIAGGILAGIATDYTGKSASVCAIMLVAAIPSLFGYKEVSSSKSL